jgi:hypothetical protein
MGFGIACIFTLVGLTPFGIIGSELDDSNPSLDKSNICVLDAIQYIIPKNKIINNIWTTFIYVIVRLKIDKVYNLLKNTYLYNEN